MSEQFKPNIVAFLCNWCTYAGADLAGTSRIQYPANVKIIRVMCSGRVNPLYVVNALQQGADGCSSRDAIRGLSLYGGELLRPAPPEAA